MLLAVMVSLNCWSTRFSPGRREDGLANPANRLAPGEVFLDALAHDLAGGVAGLPARPAVDGATAPARGVASNMRRHAALAAVGDEVASVVALVCAHSLAMHTWQGVEHRQCCRTLAVAISV